MLQVVVLLTVSMVSAIWVTSLFMPWWCSDFVNVCPSRTLRPRMQWRWLWGAQPAAVCYMLTLFSQVQEQHKVSLITQHRAHLVDPRNSISVYNVAIWLIYAANDIVFSPYSPGLYIMSKGKWKWASNYDGENVFFSSPTHLKLQLLSSLCFGPCLFNRMCVAECPRGFWGDRRRCKRCYSSCESCTGSRSDQCISCQPGHHLTEGTNTCTAICGDNYYLDHGWISGFLECFDAFY